MIENFNATVSTPKWIELPFAERMLLWGVRRWVHDRQNGTRSFEVAAEAFGRLGREGASAALDGLMRCLYRGARRNIYVNLSCWALTTLDEADLLRAVAYAQASGKVSVGPILLRFVSPRHANATERYVRTLARETKAAGLRLTIEAEGAPPTGASPRLVDYSAASVSSTSTPALKRKPISSVCERTSSPNSSAMTSPSSGRKLRSSMSCTPPEISTKI